MSKSSIEATLGSRAEGTALSPKVYLAMAITTLLTFATLATGYQMLFARSVFA